jgi:hypothetical protein
VRRESFGGERFGGERDLEREIWRRERFGGERDLEEREIWRRDLEEREICRYLEERFGGEIWRDRRMRGSGR